MVRARDALGFPFGSSVFESKLRPGGDFEKKNVHGIDLVKIACFTAPIKEMIDQMDENNLKSLKKKRGDLHFFFYKNLVYKNIKASYGPKIKNILRIYKGFKS